MQRRRCTQATNPGAVRITRVVFEATCPPIRSCSGRGLPCHCRYRQRGALLPHHFTLANALRRFGGIFSVALSVGSRPPGVTWRPDPWSPDFPLRLKTERLSGPLCVSPLPYVEWREFAKIPTGRYVPLQPLRTRTAPKPLIQSGVFRSMMERMPRIRASGVGGQPRMMPSTGMTFWTAPELA